MLDQVKYFIHMKFCVCHTIVKLISTLLCLMFFVSCENDKPYHKTIEKVILINIDTNFITGCFAKSYNQIDKICKKHMGNCLIFTECDTCNKTSLPRANTEYLYDCFSELIYCFANKNSTPSSIAYVATDYRKTLAIQNVPMLLKINLDVLFMGNDKMSLRYAFVNQNDANRIMLGERTHIKEFDIPNLSNADKKVDSSAVQIVFDNNYSADNKNCIAAVLITAKKHNY